eukprot:jgi/Ulvmu1/8662/UM046_0067.1
MLHADVLHQNANSKCDGDMDMQSTTKMQIRKRQDGLTKKVCGIVVAALLSSATATAQCPMSGGGMVADIADTLKSLGGGHTRTSDRPMKFSLYGPPEHKHGRELPPLTSDLYNSIKADIEELLSTSHNYWPNNADFGTYRGLMIRVAWHCSGTYRHSDGRGGCDGARNRFAPENLWEDNTNIDKGLHILQPLYDKYEDVISWGDLIVLVGNVAISSGGGPILGFCGGRRDDLDGSASLPLGPGPIQQSIAPCEENGLCEFPLGASHTNLIYVNPAGPANATGDPAASAANIRYIFGNMGFNDRESVALIGGGHAFGKFHSACPDGPGPTPEKSPSAPYPGACEKYPEDPRGKGRNTWTNKFEGVWTTTPTEWDNQYFQNLLKYDWKSEQSPSDKPQFAPFDKETGDAGPNIRMLVSDVAFLYDEEYKKLTEEYAADVKALERDFAAAWYKLTTKDMGPVERCTGPDVPPPQPFQDPLPAGGGRSVLDSVKDTVKAAVTSAPGWEDIKAAVREAAAGERERGLLAELAYGCAATFRATDFKGGCNGGRIRFPPQLEWPSNNGAKEALALLDPIHAKFADHISYADLIVLAGDVAVEAAGSSAPSFCPGRVDAENGETSIDLSPRTYYQDPLTAAHDTQQVMGLSPAQYVALAARPTAESPTLSNTLFQKLLDIEWAPVLKEGQLTVDPINGEYASTAGDATVPVQQWVLLRNPEMRTAVKEFATNPDALRAVFADAWTYLMNADRFDGPDSNECDMPESCAR